MFRLGVPELLIIGILILFLFGGKKLPEMGKGIGEGIRNFKSAMKEGDTHPNQPTPPAAPKDEQKTP